MEPGDRAAPALTTQARSWLRIGAGCLLLVGLAFTQSPGFLLADTKFDLAVDPGGFLARATHLWDDQGAFGQLQNQAYGYLWPMGPFFWSGDVLGLPGWVGQRLWIGLVLCVAFVGTARLARALGVRSDVACLIAGLAYATSPRLVSTLGPISIEAWPSAVAPWVLLPLVVGAERGSPRRAALWSALAVAMVGGVNAAATSAVLPLGAIWLLTRERGPRRTRLLLWWPVFTILGTLWWLVPLFLMGAYSPPFLDYIETASVTTFPTTLFDALRGTSDWVPYVDSSWLGGNETITQSYLALNAGLVLTLGLVGICLPSHPHRRFLVLSVLTGLLLVTMGHTGAVQGWLSEPLAASLDAALAPLRNVHKFDPVVRLPMVLGLAFLLEAAVRSTNHSTVSVGERTLRIGPRQTVVGLALVGVLGAALPLTTGRLGPTDPVLATPGYWSEAARWLEANTEDGAVSLMAPGSGFADYLWGSPRDEPLQWLAGSRWAVRNAVPLAPAGNIRMLDAVEERLAQGRGTPGLASYLARAGVGYVVVRNDLAPSRDVPAPALVHQALDDTPGLELARTFGPAVGGEANLETDEGRLLVDGGWQDERAAIEVYRVQGESSPAVTEDAPPVVVGGPEDLLDLADLGVLDDEPTVLASDVPADDVAPARVVLTDGMRDRERFFGRVHDAASSVRVADDPRRSGNPTIDYRSFAGGRWLTSARLDGARAVSVSSSRATSDGVSGLVPGELASAALDGDPESQWVSAPSASGSAWWRLDLAEPTPVGEVAITLGTGGSERERVVVTTDTGLRSVVEVGRGAEQRVVLDGDAVSWLRIGDDGGTGSLALAEVDVEGLDVRRSLVLPAVPDAWGPPDEIVLRALHDHRTGCVRVEGRTPCLQSRARPSEEPSDVHRVVTIPDDAAYRAEMTARPRPGAELEALLQSGLPFSVAGSSTGVADVRGSGLAAVDGDPGTAWTPDLADARPRLAMNWLGRRTITDVSLTVDPDSPVRRPVELDLRWPEGQTTVELDEDGAAELDEPVTTDRLTVSITQAENAASVDALGVGEALPLGIGEIDLGGLDLDPVRLPDVRRALPCGTGPTLVVAGARVSTALVASPSELYLMEPVPVRACDGGSDAEVFLPRGANEVDLLASTVSVPESVVLRRADGAAGAAGGESPLPASVLTSGPTTQTLEPSAGSSVLVLRQNANAGWRASQGGQDLAPLVVDGWQQAFRVDGSSTVVTARFEPDPAYRVALLAGLAVLGLMVAAAVVPGLRWPGAALPALAASEAGAGVLLLAGVVVVGLLAGWAGVACAVVGYAAALVVSERRRTDVTWVGGSLLMVAALGYAARPWGSPEGWAGSWAWPHYLVVVALSVGWAAAVGRPRKGRRSFRRMAGSST